MSKKSAMECSTIFLKWKLPPESLINLPTEGVQKFFMTNWTHQLLLNNLTVIMVQLAKKNVTRYSNEILRLAESLWADRDCKSFQLQDVNALLTSPLADFSNEASFLHTPIQFIGSFFEHVKKVVDLLQAESWQSAYQFIRADDETAFKLNCRHVSKFYCFCFSSGLC